MVAWTGIEEAHDEHSSVGCSRVRKMDRCWVGRYVLPIRSGCLNVCMSMSRVYDEQRLGGQA